MSEYVRIIPHSTDPAALEALDATLKALPMGAGLLVRHDNGDVAVFGDGSVAVSTGNPRFLKFAIERQGYAKGIVDEETDR